MSATTPPLSSMLGLRGSLIHLETFLEWGEEKLLLPELQPMIEKLWGGDALAEVRRFHQQLQKMKTELHEYMVANYESIEEELEPPETL